MDLGPMLLIPGGKNEHVPLAASSEYFIGAFTVKLTLELPNLICLGEKTPVLYNTKKTHKQEKKFHESL